MKNTKLFEQFSDRIKNLIFIGQLPVGSSLPSIRDMQQRFGVSKNTILLGLKLLSEEGIISRQGATRNGYMVIKKPADPPVHNKTTTMFSVNLAQFILPFNYWNYVGNKILEAVERKFSKNNISLIFGNNKNLLSEEKILLERISTDHTLLQALLLITGTSFDNPNIDLLNNINKHIPVILVDRCIHGFDSHYIGINNREVGYKATTYLLEKGHTNIGFVSGFKRISTMYDRYLGYRTALEHAGITPNQEHILLEESLYESLESTENAGKIIGTKILSKPDRPTALVCGSDKAALGLIRFFTQKGISIPGDISLIGCDNDMALSSLTPIKLTTFSYPYTALADEVYKIVLAVQDNPNITKKNIELKAIFVEGNTA